MYGINKIVQSTKRKCIYLTFYLSYFIFLTKLLPFQVVRNSVIEIQIIKKSDNDSQDSTISSS